jgi:uncharacterized tellurite resistance protein B-like protein
MGILDFLGFKHDTQENGYSDVESIRRISDQLNRMPPDQARYLAAFAYMLGRVANADRVISEQESATMEKIVAERGRLPAEQAVLVVELAKRQNRLFGHVEDFLVSREFNEIANRDQKLELLDCLFSVSASDEGISNAEDQEIRQIASELLLEHRDFIDIRLHYRDFLNVLKDERDN